MQITRYTLNELFSIVCQAVNESDFIAIDCELSGLGFNDSKDIRYGTLQDEYIRIAESVKNFAILQFGLTTFVWDNSNTTYISKSFSFHLRPSDEDALFMFQPSTISFLVKHGFDFNKSFYHGIQYSSTKEKQSNFESLGFDTIMNALIHSKKPIIGHCCLIDICHVCSKFLGNIVDWKDMKKCINDLFPIVIDTKYLSKMNDLDSLHLDELVKHCENLYKFSNIRFKNTEFDLFSKETSENGNFHDAAYDSYACGVVFAILIHSLHPESNKNAVSIMNQYSSDWMNRFYIRNSVHKYFCTTEE